MVMGIMRRARTTDLGRPRAHVDVWPIVEFGAVVHDQDASQLRGCQRLTRGEWLLRRLVDDIRIGRTEPIPARPQVVVFGTQCLEEGDRH